MKYCSNCGTANKDEAQFCESCGKTMEVPATVSPVQSTGSSSSASAASGEVSERKRLKAALFAYFLGWLGIHNFYLGRKVRAFIQLGLSVILGWVFGIGLYVSAIWALVEMIIILKGSCKDGDGRLVTEWVNKD